MVNVAPVPGPPPLPPPPPPPPPPTAAGGDVPVVRVDESFRNCQADAGTTVFAVACRVGPIEAFEYVGEVLGGYSVAVVGHRDDDFIAFGGCGDIHPAATRGVAQRVVEQVRQDLSEPMLIRP
jgi:hypothetical protein